MARLAIYGAGGFGREVATFARRVLAGRELVFVVDTPSEPVQGISVLQLDDLAPEDELVIALGDSGERRMLAERCAGRKFARLYANTATIPEGAEIGEGAVFSDYTMVTDATARIGRHFQCNIYSYVAHDCIVGDYVTFAPKVCCNGWVEIGDGAYVGTGAVIRPGVPRGKRLRIGAGAVIGMGAVVTKDVPDGATVVGNPAKPRD